MYADSTCCQIALAQNSLYGKCYVSATYNSLSTSSIANHPCITVSIPYMEFSCRCHSTTDTSLMLLPFGLCVINCNSICTHTHTHTHSQILQAHPLMETERKLFVYFFTDPSKLSQVVAELARRVDAIATAQNTQ